MKLFKFIIIENVMPQMPKKELRLGYVEMHKHLLTQDDIKYRNQVLGGGMFSINPKTKEISFYDRSWDFGKFKENDLIESLNACKFHTQFTLEHYGEEADNNFDIKEYDVVIEDWDNNYKHNLGKFFVE